MLTGPATPTREAPRPRVAEPLDKAAKLGAELRAEADIDSIDLPLIAASVRREFEQYDDDGPRRHSLDMVRVLIDMDVFAGDHTLDDLESGRGFHFRCGETEEIISWIEAEWVALGHVPTQEELIC